MRRAWVVVAVLAVAVAACGGSGEKSQDKSAEAAKPAAQQPQQPAQQPSGSTEQAAKGLEEMAKGLQAMAGGGASGEFKQVDPVSFRDLMALFPDLEGWTKEKPTGERMSSPVSFSTAQVRYAKGDSSIELKMVDSGFNQILFTPYAMFLTAGYEKETSDGYEKSTKVNNQPGWEKWNSESKNGELNALVGKRFLVTIEGSGIGDTKVLHEVAGKIDMGKLAAMK